MRRFSIVSIAAFGCAVWAANFKLYMTDGSYQLVSDYKGRTDRVRFYSTERSDWEEVPLDMVDLKRTKAEAAAREEQSAKADKDAGRGCLRRARPSGRRSGEFRRIPGCIGWRATGPCTSPSANRPLRTDKGRKIRRASSAAADCPRHGESRNPPSAFGAHLTDPSPEFYIQLSDPEAFAIVKVATKKDVRIVATVLIDAMTKEYDEQWVTVDLIQQELSEGL